MRKRTNQSPISEWSLRQIDNPSAHGRGPGGGTRDCDRDRFGGRVAASASGKGERIRSYLSSARTKTEHPVPALNVAFWMSGSGATNSPSGPLA